MPVTGQIEKNLNDFTVSSKIIFPLGIMINEMLTNSMKYAFSGRDSGLIKISIGNEGQRATVIYEDNGVGIPEKDKNGQDSFGLVLIDMLVKQLDGECKVTGENGLKYIIGFDI